MADAIVVRERGDVVAYAWARPRGSLLHVVHVVVAPDKRGQGLGRVLMAALAARARAAGLPSWMLNVKPDNLAARALYERCGMAVVSEGASMRLAWANVARLEEAPGVTTSVVEAPEDAAFERAFSLERGEIAGLRATRTPLGAREGGAPVSFGAFDPHVPGLAPLRVRAPRYVRPVLEAARSYAPPGQAHVLAFVEGDRALACALESVGGTVVLRALRMRGDVPA
jgi:predicted GNAT family acetyltransferase